MASFYQIVIALGWAGIITAVITQLAFKRVKLAVIFSTLGMFAFALASGISHSYFFLVINLALVGWNIHTYRMLSRKEQDTRL